MRGSIGSMNKEVVPLERDGPVGRLGMRGRMRTLLATWGLSLALVSQVGCLRCCHPVYPPPKEELLPYQDVAQCQKNKVHVFFVHGLDPLDLSNYEGLHDYVQSLGYIKTYYGWTYHAFLFEKELRALHQDEPDARIVLVGFSYGGGLIRDMACSVRAAGIPIDLVVYIDGVEWKGRPLHRPANVARVVNILSSPRSDESMVKEGENHRYDDAWHFGTVTHPQTLRLMARELADVARRVPIVQHLPPAEVKPGQPAPKADLPPPTEVPKGKPDEWGFLRPDDLAQGVLGSKPLPDAFATMPATAKEPK